MELEEGKTYTLIFREKQEHKKPTKIRKKMKLIKLYPHIALFETPKGVRQSFQYWDLNRMLEGAKK